MKTLLKLSFILTLLFTFSCKKGALTTSRSINVSGRLYDVASGVGIAGLEIIAIERSGGKTYFGGSSPDPAMYTTYTDFNGYYKLSFPESETRDNFEVMFAYNQHLENELYYYTGAQSSNPYIDKAGRYEIDVALTMIRQTLLKARIVYQDNPKDWVRVRIQDQMPEFNLRGKQKDTIVFAKVLSNSKNDISYRIATDQFYIETFEISGYPDTVSQTFTVDFSKF